MQHKKSDILALLEAALEIPNIVHADLETGSHHFNNAASAKFAEKHAILTKHLNEMVLLAQRIERDGGVDA